MANNDFKESLRYPRTYDNPEQQDLNEKFMSLLDEYEKNNSFENREFLCYLTSAIFLTYKKLYPQLVIYIPFRTKSDASYIKNIQKEVEKFTDSKEPFDISPITKDISGIRIVLDNINFSLPPKGKSQELFNDPEISELLESSKNNFKFIEEELEIYLKSPIQTGKKYFELKKELLERIVTITPSNFKEERKPYPSFSRLLDDTNDKYNYFLENDSFPTIISDSEIDELSDLLNDLRSRIYDPLHFAILRKTIPVVFEDPLIKNVLQTSFEWNKEPTKPNGFQAIYYALHTPFGYVEVQAQSNKAYYASTKGSAYHSGMDGKTINIKDFFELVNPDDKHDISYYLDNLDNVSADSLISPYEIPEFKTEQEKEEFLKTPRGKNYLESEQYREMMQHIKIKEKMLLTPERPIEEEYISKQYEGKEPQEINEMIQKSNSTVVDTNEYLLSTALSLSPYMNVCSSGHTSYTNASIHHKKVIGEFSEILRKKDSNTCLRDMLIRKLENLIENNLYLNPVSSENLTSNMNRIIQIVKKHEEMASRLPKDVSTKNIIAYAEKLRNIKRLDSELDQSI